LKPGVDPYRIGLWGASLGGDNVLCVATNEKCVKCVVNPIPSMDESCVYLYYQSSNMKTQQARGDIEPD